MFPVFFLQLSDSSCTAGNRVAGVAAALPFWLEPELFFWSGSGSCSYSTVIILLLQNKEDKKKLKLSKMGGSGNPGF